MTILFILAAGIIVVLFIFNSLKGKLISVAIPQEESSTERFLQGKISLLTYNIAGLPQGISAAKLPRKFSIARIGDKVEPYGVVNVQEDFIYNTSFYSKNLHPDRTLSKGKIPVGDGLNTLSKYPLIEYRRISWRHCSGP